MIGKKINQLATELAPTTTDLTIIGDPISGVSKKITLEQLGAIFGGAVSFYTTLGDFPATGVIDIIYCAKDTKKLYLWSGSAYVEVFPSQSLLDTYQLRSEKGVSNGYASLDVNGKVPIGQLPNSIMEYKGTWSAATNTPTLANGTGDTGDVYICNAAGSVNFGAGAISFAVGDYVVYSGTIWQRSSGAVGTVTSVAASITGDSITISNSPITTSGTLAFAFGGNSTQYINGAGNLVTFPGIINEAQNLITEVYNKTGATLTKGTVVYINGGQGNLPSVTKALATGDSTSAQTYGIVRNDITNNNNGYVVVAGRISDLDTQAYTEGTQLYLSPTTAGTFTSTKPYAPQHLVYVGIVVRAHPTQGVVEVKIQNGYEMDELHNVAAQSPSNGDILQYVSATSLWTKTAGTTTNIAEGSNLYYTDARSRAALSFTAGSGAYNSTTGVITIPTNTNQLTNGASFITLASLSAGAGISYNNTTGVIASTITQYTDANARAAISLTTSGTSGAATYNSTTGVLNVPQYAPDLSGYVPTSRTLTINGTAYDLSANRSWSVGTVTSVGLSSATSGVTIGSTPITTSGTITLAIATASGSQNGLLSSTDWTTFNNKQNALTNPVTGTGTTNYLPKFTGTSTIGNSVMVEGTNGIGVNNTSPNTSYGLTVSGPTLYSSNALRLERNGISAQGLNISAGGEVVTFNGFNTASDGLNSAFVWTSTAYSTTTTRMTLNASGNLGLGVTPSAWALYKSIQVQGASIANFDTSDNSIVGSNVFYGGSPTDFRYISTGTSTMYRLNGGVHSWYQAPSGTAGNAISFTQAMTLNASGNLGIGTTSPSGILHVLKSAADVYIESNGGTGNTSRLILKNTAREWRTGADTDGSFWHYDATAGSYRFLINSSGNVGLGVTPSAWMSGSTGLQVLRGGLWHDGSGYISMFNNAYYDGSNWRYIATTTASNYAQVNGNHQWFQAPSGTAGNTISFTQAMTLNASGNLGLGVTPSAWSLGKAIEIGNIGNAIWSVNATQYNILHNAYYNGGYVYATSNPSSYYQQASGGHGWYTAPSGTAGNAITFTPVMYLNASGNLSIGNTNDTFKLDVSGEGRFYQPATTSTAYLRVENNRSRNAALRLTTTLGDFLLGVGIGADTNQFQIYDNTAGANRLTISSTGAATFSSSVTAVGLFSTTSASGTLAAKIRNGITAASGSTGYGLAIESEASAATSYALTVRNLAESTTYFHISTETGKVGNVGIGTTSPTATLHVNGTIKTGAPSVGSAETWKLGSYAAGGTGTATGVIYIEVNGQIYSIPALLGTP